MKQKTALVTGVAGMIGSHLLDQLLNKNYRVIGVDNLSYGSMENIQQHHDNQNFTFHKADIMDLPSMQKFGAGVDVILHLAAVKKIGEKDISYPTISVNTEGTENMLKVARANKCKLIFASTSDVYGMSPDLPLSEDGDLLLGPSMIRRWSYAVSKLYGEQMAFAYYHDFKVPIVVLRYFGAFSPRSSFAWSGGHIPIFIRSILNDEEVMVHGDGKQTRSMGFVDDLVEGTILAMENELAEGEIINIGNDQELSVIDTARMIHRMANTGKALKIKYIPMQEVFGKYKDIMRRIPDLSKAKRILGYSPKVTLELAIEKTIAEIKKSL
jgi:UDP-glucose 4-epimerase